MYKNIKIFCLFWKGLVGKIRFPINLTTGSVTFRNTGNFLEITNNKYWSDKKNM